jgi:hypothetical protein
VKSFTSVDMIRRHSSPAIASPKATGLQRLRAPQAEKVALRAMAHRRHTDGAPTPRGKGRRQEATIGKRRMAQKE